MKHPLIRINTMKYNISLLLTITMAEVASALQPFYNVIEMNEFSCYSRNMKDKFPQPSDLDPRTTVYIYKERDDIARICRKEEKRAELFSGTPRKIHDDTFLAVFRWNRLIGVVTREPSSEEKWKRFFKMDSKSPCIICMETGKDRTICCNCTSSVCFDCRGKLNTTQCPGCTVEVDDYRI